MQVLVNYSELFSLISTLLLVKSSFSKRGLFYKKLLYTLPKYPYQLRMVYQWRGLHYQQAKQVINLVLPDKLLSAKSSSHRRNRRTASQILLSKPKYMYLHTVTVKCLTPLLT